MSLVTQFPKGRISQKFDPGFRPLFPEAMTGRQSDDKITERPATDDQDGVQ
jgi:hypothetical protein